jgi:acyl-coenzyme A thioesterase PaaI-like protein
MGRLSMTTTSFQDHYPRETRYCYGCGPLNEQGYHLRSFWEGDETTCRFDPEPFHTSMPGYVYGGLIASLIDCHGTGSAAAFAYRAEGREVGSEPPLRFVTASLHVDYLKPTPLGVTLTLRGREKRIKGRVVTVEISLYASGVECARGEVVAVRMPEGWLDSLKTNGP